NRNDTKSLKQTRLNYQKDKCDGNKTAPKIVENLPPRDRGNRIIDPAMISTGSARQQPRQNLPVPPHPAFSPADIHLVNGYLRFVNLHVAHQSRPDVKRF